MKNPCHKCTDDRHYKSHSTCKDYKEYADQQEERRKVNQREQDIKGYCADRYHKLEKTKFRQTKIRVPKED